MLRQHRARTLRYLPVDLLRAHALDFTRLDVRCTTGEGEVLGAVEGFIVDTIGRRLHRIIVDCGAWFTGGSYVLPPECTRVDVAELVLWVDVTRESLQAFPRFDPLAIEELPDDVVWAYERSIVDACVRVTPPAASAVTAAAGREKRTAP